MGLLGWIRKMLWHRETAPEITEARAVARRIGERADALQQHFSQYHRARDPFAAMMADLYNRDQVEKIWHGPNRD